MSGEVAMQFRDAAVVAVEIAGGQLIEDDLCSSDRCGGAGEGLTDETGFGFVFIGEKRGADLAEFSDGDDIDMLIETEGLEAEELCESAKGLYFIEIDCDVVCFEDVDDGEKKFA